ncbi:hypothetical protein GOBAR_DD26033 [Gossypium barbadense]|nr:hypothetical protein GOBAR_DD26033 [Gossypium barbadense]
MMLRFLPSSTPAKLFEFYGSGSEVVEEKQQYLVAMRDAKRNRATPAKGTCTNRSFKEKDTSHTMENAEKMLLNSPTPTMRLMGKHFQQEWLLDPALGKCKETSLGINWQANPEFQIGSSITIALELEPERNETSVGGWILSESQYDGFGLSAGIDFSKVDAYDVTRLGPIKLSPRVKHILKPNQKVDQDNSRLNHLTIPFASVTGCGKMLETLKKSRKIYRF